MKKLYKKGTVHPTPPLILDQLSFLPATILTLAAALSFEDREVLAYLLSCSSNNYAGNNKNIIHKNTTTAINRSSSSSSSCSGGGGDHPPCFTCCCFRCYMSYWARWDASPNRQLIHEIIDAFEEGLTTQGKKEKGKRQRRNAGGDGGSRGSYEFIRPEMSLNRDEFGDSDSVEESSTSAGGGGGSGGEDGEGDIEVLEKGSVRRLVSFLGDKIWSVWN